MKYNIAKYCMIKQTLENDNNRLPFYLFLQFQIKSNWDQYCKLKIVWENENYHLGIQIELNRIRNTFNS